MKKILIGLAALVVIVIAVVVIAPFLIPVETYKEQIAAQAREATGRELAINGEFGISLLPRLELVAEDVTFANAPGAQDPQMVTLKSLLVQLQVWPLISGEVKVDSFVLVDPVIHLEVDAQGRPNWDFGGAAETATTDTAGTGEAGPPRLKQVSLGDVRLENGLVTYRDAASGQSAEISEINMAISLPDLDSPVAAEGSLVWNGEKLEIALETEKLRGLMAGETTPLSLEVESEPVTLAYAGTTTQGPPGRIEGTLDLDVPSVRELAAWAGNPIEGGGSGLGPLKIKGKVAAVGPSYSFTEAAISLDEINATGNLSADLGGKKPELAGNLDVDRIDLNTYLPPDAGAQAGGGTQAEGGAQPPAGGAGWSEDPIDVAGLHGANVVFDLTVGGIQVQQIEVGRSALALVLKDGLLTLDLTELNLYDGSGTGRLSVDGRGQVPAVAKSFAIQGVNAEPLLTDAAGFDSLEGNGAFDISITAKGRSQKEMVEALNGKGAVKFVDGAIKGINLGAMVRNVGSAFLDAEAGRAQKTDFAELSGTFQINNGILTNNDLLLLNPLLRLTGAGQADMPKRTVNYRVTPKAVASVEGQGGATEQAGVAVPVIIEGPWHDLQYRPDLAGMVEGIAKDPTKALEGAKGAVDQLKEGATGGIGEVLKGVTQPSQEGGTEGTGSQLPDPAGTIKKLFGN